MKIKAFGLAIVLCAGIFGASVLLATATSDAQSLLHASSAAEVKPAEASEVVKPAQDSSQGKPEASVGEVSAGGEGQLVSSGEQPGDLIAFPPIPFPGRISFRMSTDSDGPRWPMGPDGFSARGPRAFPVLPESNSFMHSSDSNLAELARDQARIISDQAETIRVLQSQLMGKALADGDRGGLRRRRWSSDNMHENGDHSYGDGVSRFAGRGPGYWRHQRDFNRGDDAPQDSLAAEAPYMSPMSPVSPVEARADELQKIDSSVSQVPQPQNLADTAQNVLAPVVAQARSFLPPSSSLMSGSASSLSSNSEAAPAVVAEATQIK
jgi:hypothetical protein